MVAMPTDALLSAAPVRSSPTGTGILAVDAAGLKQITEAVLVGSTPFSADGSTTTQTPAKRAAYVVNVKDYGAVGDNVADDATAFQKALNRLYVLGGGVLEVPHATYRIGIIPLGSVPNIIGNGQVADSGCLVIPSDVTVRGNGSTLNLVGGTTSPFGYPLAVQLLTFSGHNIQRVTVTAANNAAKTVTVDSGTSIPAGTKVVLGRLGNGVGGTTLTPSGETSACQFLTVLSCVSGTVTFVEGFTFDYHNMTGLHIEVLSGYMNKNVYLEDLILTTGYTLFTRTYKSGLKGVSFVSGATVSWGTCQHAVLDKVHIDIGPMTIEAVNGLDIGTMTLDGYGSTDKLGGLFITDNCRAVHIDHITARDWDRSAVVMFYGIDAEISRIDLFNCGMTYDTYCAGLSVGMPAEGAYATLSSARSERYQVRNVMNSRISIGSVRSYGPSRVPLRAHDVALSIGSAYIEYSGDSDSFPFIIGQSGKNRADVINTAGGVSSLDVRSFECRSLNGTPRLPLFNGGSNSPVAGAVAYLASPAAPADTTLTLDRPGAFMGAYGYPIYYDNLAADLNTPSQNVVASVNGTTLTLSAPLGVSLPSGAGVWGTDGPNDLLRAMRITKYLDLTSQRGCRSGVESYYPYTATGGGPYTGTFDLTAPSEGSWDLEVAFISTDLAHCHVKRYSVVWTTLNGTYPMGGLAVVGSNLLRTNAQITGESINNNVVTLTLQSATSGQRATLHVKWTKAAEIVGLL